MLLYIGGVLILIALGIIITALLLESNKEKLPPPGSSETTYTLESLATQSFAWVVPVERAM